MKAKIFFFLLFLIFSQSSIFAQDPVFPVPNQPYSPNPVFKGDAPYVPTDEAVVWEMLDLAKVSEGDVVYDLGCGDGRIVISAAKKFGVRGVGVDLNPHLIRYSRDNAVKAGVADRVRFLEQNFLDTDLQEATVVTLFLSDAANLKLRPKILKEMRPGSRVVSNEFDMGMITGQGFHTLWRVGPFVQGNYSPCRR